MAKRLFIALELHAGCRETLAALAEPIPGARWIPADQLHLTLAFLGNIGVETEIQLRDSMAELRVPSFSLRLRGVGAFRSRRSTVLWAGVEDAHDGLMTLHGEVRRALAMAHIELKSAPFHPHVTIARLKGSPAHRIHSFVKANASREFGTVAIEDFTLFSSVLGAVGAAYHAEERYALVTG